MSPPAEAEVSVVQSFAESGCTFESRVSFECAAGLQHVYAGYRKLGSSSNAEFLHPVPLSSKRGLSAAAAGGHSVSQMPLASLGGLGMCPRALTRAPSARRIVLRQGRW